MGKNPPTKSANSTSTGLNRAPRPPRRPPHPLQKSPVHFSLPARPTKSPTAPPRSSKHYLRPAHHHRADGHSRGTACWSIPISDTVTIQELRSRAPQGSVSHERRHLRLLQEHNLLDDLGEKTRRRSRQPGCGPGLAARRLRLPSSSSPSTPTARNAPRISGSIMKTSSPRTSTRSPENNRPKRRRSPFGPSEGIGDRPLPNREAHFSLHPSSFIPDPSAFPLRKKAFTKRPSNLRDQLTPRLDVKDAMKSTSGTPETTVRWPIRDISSILCVPNGAFLRSRAATKIPSHPPLSPIRSPSSHWRGSAAYNHNAKKEQRHETHYRQPPHSRDDPGGIHGLPSRPAATGTAGLAHRSHSAVPSGAAHIVPTTTAQIPAVQTTQFNPNQGNSAQVIPTAQTNAGPTYVEVLNPHVEAAFAPLEADRGRLSESDPSSGCVNGSSTEQNQEEAREGVEMVDRLLVVMHERERFRLRLDSSTGNFSDEFFRGKLLQEWSTRSRELSLAFNRAIGPLSRRTKPGSANTLSRITTNANTWKHFAAKNSARATA